MLSTQYQQIKKERHDDWATRCNRAAQIYSDQELLIEAKDTKGDWKLPPSNGICEKGQPSSQRNNVTTSERRGGSRKDG